MNKPIIVTCTGFYGTGSSAITDLLRECDNVYCPEGDYEVRFIHDPDGLSDLEYNLIDNPNRHNTSHAIKRFKSMVDLNSDHSLNRHYERMFGGQFKTISYQYIDEICAFKYLSQWHYDLWLRGKGFMRMNRLIGIFLYLLRRIFHNSKKSFRPQNLIPKNEMAYAGIFDETLFLSATQKYLGNLFTPPHFQRFEAATHTMVDQLLPPSNLQRYVRYFPEGALRVYIVERDPRDLFLLEKHIWKGVIIPCASADIFCNWYLWTRGQYKKYPLPKEALQIQFEDLLYHYDETAANIFRFAGIDRSHHTHPKTFLIPEMSKAHTRLWEKFPEYKADIQLIENRLKEYCYPY